MTCGCHWTQRRHLNPEVEASVIQNPGIRRLRNPGDNVLSNLEKNGLESRGRALGFSVWDADGASVRVYIRMAISEKVKGLCDLKVDFSL